MITEKIPMMRGDGLRLIRTVGEQESILNVSSFETDTVSLVHFQQFWRFEIDIRSVNSSDMNLGFRLTRYHDLHLTLTQY